LELLLLLVAWRLVARAACHVIAAAAANADNAAYCCC
jgi:hypothetical protein